MYLRTLRHYVCAWFSLHRMKIDIRMTLFSFFVVQRFRRVCVFYGTNGNTDRFILFCTPPQHIDPMLGTSKWRIFLFTWYRGENADIKSYHLKLHFNCFEVNSVTSCISRVSVIQSFGTCIVFLWSPVIYFTSPSNNLTSLLTFILGIPV